MGFDAIWISPHVKNEPNSYHGYGAINFYEVNPHFGTEEDLHNLVKTAHSKDIWVMIDVVANHVANTKEDFTKITPFNKPEHYHVSCEITDWNDPVMIE